MKTLLRGLSAAVLALGLQLAQAGVLPGPLVDAKWLAANLDKVQVVDVRSNVKTYTVAPQVATDAKTGKKSIDEVGGHLAGSRLIDMKTMRTDRQIGELKVKYMIPEKAEFEKAVQVAGVAAGKPIVLVPLGAEVADVNDALRVYWQFKVYGEDDIAVLDGGMAAWLLEGRATSTDLATSTAGNWVAKADRTAQYFASSEDVVKAMVNKGATLIDARDARQFHGLVKRDYVGGYGHLEGAKLYPTDLMQKSAAGAVSFMSPATYRGLMSAQGIDPTAPAITYCNSGHLSSGPWFLLSEVLGNKQARLYDGSLHEWTLEKRALAGAVPLN
jgi:thiosulfate/3-mercaptopyruvate sulfurtransferase